MTTINLPAILARLAPSAQWAIRGEVQTAEDYASALTWLDNGQPPSWDEITTAAGDVTAAIATERRRAEVVARLAALDTASARPLRAIIAGTATPDDHSRLAAIETEAGALRAELADLIQGA